MIGASTKLTTSGQQSHNFGPSTSIDNNTTSLHPVLSYLCMIHKSIFDLCGSIIHNAYACTIRGPKLLLPSIRIKMNQLNSLCDEEPNETPRDCNS